MGQRAGPDYPKTAALLALVGGIVILLGGVLFIVASTYILPHVNYGNLTIPRGLNAASIPALVSGIVGVMGAFGLVSGGIVLTSAAMLLAQVGQPRTWGVLILIFSVLSFVGLGGFVVGAILGIIGGVLALRWKPSTPLGPSVG